MAIHLPNKLLATAAALGLNDGNLMTIPPDPLLQATWRTVMRNAALIGFTALTVFTGTLVHAQATSAPSEDPQPSARVENGGFERPDVDSYKFFSERIPGWTVLHDGVEIIDASYGNGFRVYSGNQLVALSGSGAISQAVPTDPGAPYCLVFYLSREPDAPAPSTLTVEAGDVREDYKIMPEENGYRREVLRFAGASGAEATRITFTSTTGDTEYGPIIDDVGVKSADSCDRE
jgi:hypothetical protein